MRESNWKKGEREVGRREQSLCRKRRTAMSVSSAEPTKQGEHTSQDLRDSVHAMACKQDWLPHHRRWLLNSVDGTICERTERDAASVAES